MYFSRPIQWYHSHVDPIWLDDTFKVALTHVICQKKRSWSMLIKIDFHEILQL
jgi:hypothetical protein